MFVEMPCVKALLALVLCLISKNQNLTIDKNNDTVVALSNTAPLQVSPKYFLPSTSSASSESYVVIFNAGTASSRAHVFCFDHQLNLVPIAIGNQLEYIAQSKPGLSGYNKINPDAALSLGWIREEAEGVVPQDMRHRTPLKFRVTADLRQLLGDTSEKVLQAVKDYLKDKSTLKTKAGWVTVLHETEEVAYMWVSINYLLGKLDKIYTDTVEVMDLEGGSVQMAYAISETDAAKAPRISKPENPYVKEMYLKGTKYYLYVHSLLNYGLFAARAEILGIDKDSDNPCILTGYSGSYRYQGTMYKASASPSGPSIISCRKMVLKALNMNTPFTNMTRVFGGVLSGKRDLFLTSYFFDRAAKAGFIDVHAAVVKVHVADFGNAAKRACETKLKDAKSIYPHVEAGNLPYLCMDLVYQFTLLVDGFGLNPLQEITLVKKVKYQNSLVEASWPLGSAIETVSAQV